MISYAFLDDVKNYNYFRLKLIQARRWTDEKRVQKNIRTRNWADKNLYKISINVFISF